VDVGLSVTQVLQQFPETTTKSVNNGGRLIIGPNPTIKT